MGGFHMNLTPALLLVVALGTISTATSTALPRGAMCIVGGLLPNPECAGKLECILYDEGDIPVDKPARGLCGKVNANVCFDKARNLYFAPKARIKGECGQCRCSPKGGVKQCPLCVLPGGRCSIGGFIRTPPPPCKAGFTCVINQTNSMIPDIGMSGVCAKPNRDTCFVRGPGIYVAPNTVVNKPSCGSCKCAAKGGKLQCSECVPAGSACSVGGFRRTPPTPCEPGFTCVLNSESIIADKAIEGVCRVPDRNTCYSADRNMTFAPKAIMQHSNCGKCKCSDQGGQWQCEKCVLGGGNCHVGGNMLPLPMPCQKGFQCVLKSVARMPDISSPGVCKIPNRNTCFDPTRRQYVAPNGTIPFSDCGPCKCSATGGQFQCADCILEGGRCTVGGRFVVRPKSCKNGTQCVLYDEGLIAADVPAVGFCKVPDRRTCYSSSKEMYFSPGAKISNGCGPCKCADGRITCNTTVVSCLVDPCMGKTCSKSSQAVCVSNYCGGCNYAFYLNGVKITC